MRKILVGLAILSLIVGVAMANNDDEEKITICHNTHSDTNPSETIDIAISAWPAHLAHGDTLGSCPDAPIPEMGTIVLSSMGLLGMVLVARKYRQ